LAAAALSASVALAISMGRLLAKFINCAWLGRPPLPPRVGIEMELSGSRASVSGAEIVVTKCYANKDFIVITFSFVGSIIVQQAILLAHLPERSVVVLLHIHQAPRVAGHWHGLNW